MISNELNHLAAQALRIAQEHGFTEATPAEDVALIHSEASELLEDIRGGRSLNKLHYVRKVKIPNPVAFLEEHQEVEIEMPCEGFKDKDGKLNKPCGVPSELADIIIRVAHFCGKHNIDIAQAVREKMEYNESRPFKHGGKAL